jgi:chaperonin cofactor prefoldin
VVAAEADDRSSDLEKRVEDLEMEVAVLRKVLQGMEERLMSLQSLRDAQA